MNQPAASLIVLVAPLDWGLGHATRCIPIIQQLLKDNVQVIIAASGKGKCLLQAEFPQVEFVHLPGYEIQYASSAWAMPLKIVAQIPKLLSAIKKENQWLKKIVSERKIDLVISDNRYGLYHKNIRSIFITHQLQIKGPVKWIEGILRKLNYKYINRFNECWVPDYKSNKNLAGALSHPQQKPAISLHYIGTLSRFKEEESITSGNYLLILISGPEPQRSMMERLMLEELKGYKKQATVIRGLPQPNGKKITVGENITVYNHLPAAELAEKIKGTSFVIGRCGYSTVMDLAASKKRSILIPTPGQTEQEYLAKHLMKMNFALCIRQKKFRMKPALELAANFSYISFETNENNLPSAIESLLKSCDDH